MESRRRRCRAGTLPLPHWLTPPPLGPALHCHMTVSCDSRGRSAFTLSQRILVMQSAAVSQYGLVESCTCVVVMARDP